MEKEEQATEDRSRRVETDLDVVERLSSIDSKKQEEELAKLASARDLASSEEMIGYADQRNREKVYLILSRADSEFWTKEKVYGLAAIFVDAILYEYDDAEDSRLLLPIIRRKSLGLRRTLTSKS